MIELLCAFGLGVAITVCIPRLWKKIAEIKENIEEKAYLKEWLDAHILPLQSEEIEDEEEKPE